jgi:hypothetical protein
MDETYGYIRADISTCAVEHRGSRLDISTKTLSAECPSGADALIAAADVLYEAACKLGQLTRVPNARVTCGNMAE